MPGVGVQRASQEKEEGERRDGGSRIHSSPCGCPSLPKPHAVLHTHTGPFKTNSARTLAAADMNTKAPYPGSSGMFALDGGILNSEKQ